MSSVDLWWLTLNGPQNAAHASPLAMYELAKKRLSVAENPSVSVEFSPMKQFLAIALLLTDEPRVTMHPSIIAPAPTNTLLSRRLHSVVSLMRCAPLTSVHWVIQELVISIVSVMRTLSSISVRFGIRLITSSITILLTASLAWRRASMVASASSYCSPKHGGSTVRAAI